MSIGSDPNGPVTVWDIEKARPAVKFDPVESGPTISADASTFAVARGADEGRAPLEALVVRRGKRMRLAEPRADGTSNSASLEIRALSANGRYMLTSNQGVGPGGDPQRPIVVDLWDIDAARRIERFSLPYGDEPDWASARVSNQGKVLLLRGLSVLQSGKWDACDS